MVLRWFVMSLAALVAVVGMWMPEAFNSVADARTLDGAGAVQQEKKVVIPTHEHSEECQLTTAEPVQIICILDRSGSMRALADDTIGGYNSFLEKQKNEPGGAEVTTVLFDDRYERIVDSVNILEAPEMTSKEYYARGMTALLDAVGRTITDTLGRMEKENICPEKRRVLILIMTDGKENDSKEYDKETVKALIDKTTEAYGWNYIFMGANIDSVAEAGAIGIKAAHAMNYKHNSAGIADSFARMDAAATEMRETGNVSGDWKK